MDDLKYIKEEVTKIKSIVEKLESRLFIDNGGQCLQTKVAKNSSTIKLYGVVFSTTVLIVVTLLAACAL